MYTLILRIRIFLTIWAIGFPLYTFWEEIKSFFSRIFSAITTQLSIAKENIRRNPWPKEKDWIDDNDWFDRFEQEYEPLVEETVIITEEIEDDVDHERDEIQNIDSVQTNLSSEKNEQLIENTENPATTTAPNELDDRTIIPEAQAVSSTFTAEQLAQSLDDIKYAALSYKERGKKDEYEKKLIEWIALVGNHEEFLVMLADHYFEAGHYVKAATLLKKITHFHPDNHKAIRQLGQIYIHDGDAESGKLLLEKARDLKADNPKYLISLVEVYYAEKNLKECVMIVEKLSKLRPANTDYLLTLWQLHEELNQPTKAHSYYMKVLELNPLNDEAKQAIKRLL
jgi:tetratricopeptide (TPR) repeat protein